MLNSRYYTQTINSIEQKIDAITHAICNRNLDNYVIFPQVSSKSKLCVFHVLNRTSGESFDIIEKIGTSFGITCYDKKHQHKFEFLQLKKENTQITQLIFGNEHTKATPICTGRYGLMGISKKIPGTEGFVPIEIQELSKTPLVTWCTYRVRRAKENENLLTSKESINFETADLLLIGNEQNKEEKCVDLFLSAQALFMTQISNKIKLFEEAFVKFYRSIEKSKETTNPDSNIDNVDPSDGIETNYDPEL